MTEAKYLVGLILHAQFFMSLFTLKVGISNVHEEVFPQIFYHVYNKRFNLSLRSSYLLQLRNVNKIYVPCLLKFVWILCGI